MNGEGKTAGNAISSNVGARGLKGYAEAQSDPALRKILAQYSGGGMKLNDAVKAAQGAFKADTSGIDSQISAIKAQREAAMAGRGSSGGMFGGALGALAGGSGAGALAGAVGAGIGGSSNGTGDEFNSYEGQIKDLEAKRQGMLDREQFGTDSGVHRLFQDPTTGSIAATEQVRGNDILKGTFGEGGLQDRLLAEEKDLGSRGYSLKPEDYEAYGQASDETARMFGQEESGLANALASRGLAAGDSGAAGVGYSGLMGNKSERLASAQRKIANDRMNMNQQRLQAVRSQALQTAQQGASAIQDQYGRNQQGIGAYKDNLKDALTVGQMEQGQENAAFGQREATRGPTLGEVGLSLGTRAAGAGLGALTGGLGSAAAGSITGGGGAAAGAGMGTDASLTSAQLAQRQAARGF